MATDPGTIEFLLDQLGKRDAVFSAKRMFGEYCLYRAGVPVAFVCDDQLFVKDTAPGRAAIASQMSVETGPPYPGAKLYLRVSPDAWDDGDWLRKVLDVTAAALPAPKPKAMKPAKATGAPTKAGKTRRTSVTDAHSPSGEGEKRSKRSASGAAKPTAGNRSAAARATDRKTD
ncbi:TfoX/Sxy family protein [Cognatilysobacter lacus]|uniref:TfoX/Sxy family protein n=1 Tax=Cognatilysobacter lacus TaxID=1643323 RepID=A0A5D8Z7P5_9GAMM|nr:TfoX/Sxy family protein [Lysobacter lacus]TZF90566.1 TfoX/Sxy family protein [Lysobacter lacus]